MDLAEKYRPKSFDEVVGQNRVVSLIRQDFEKKLPSNFYLFYGHWGCGKTTIARLIALYLNCSNITDSSENNFPCQTCDHCKQILEGSFSEYIEINAANVTGVDDSRQLLLRLRHSVSKSSWRVVVMDECHRLSKEAMDLWLKPLESGISRTVVVFCTTDIGKVPNTIKSRSPGGGYAILPVGVDDILKVLKFIVVEEGIRANESDLQRLIGESGGSVRDAINALVPYYNIGELDGALIRKDYYGVTPDDTIKLFDLLHGGRFEESYWIVSNWMKNNLTPEQIYNILMEHVGNMLAVFTLKHRGWSSDEIKRVTIQRKKYGEDLIGEILDALMDFHKYLRGYTPLGYSAQMNLLMGRVHLRIRRFKQYEGAKKSVDALITSTTGAEIGKEGQDQSESRTTNFFPEKRDIEDVAIRLGGRVTFYNPDKGKAMIFLDDGDMIDVLKTVPETPKDSKVTAKKYLTINAVAEIVGSNKSKEEILSLLK